MSLIVERFCDAITERIAKISGIIAVEDTIKVMRDRLSSRIKVRGRNM